MKSARNTAAKVEIRKLLNNSPVALSHSEIQLATNGLCDRVTIYRVLQRLLDEGSVHKVVNVDGVVKYAGFHSCTEKNNHIHFSCEKCKSVTCLEDVEPYYKLPKEYKVKETNFTISGLCPQCS